MAVEANQPLPHTETNARKPSSIKARATNTTKSTAEDMAESTARAITAEIIRKEEKPRKMHRR